MSSRNKLPAGLPLWADPLARLYYWSDKAIDRLALSYEHWKVTRFHGLHRLPKEHFRTFVSRRAGVDAADTLVFHHAGLWWLLTSVRDATAPGRHLQIHHIDDLLAGRWQARPVNAERRYQGASGRNAESLLMEAGALLRPLQHNPRYYGESLHRMRIDLLTPTEFRETPYRGAHALCFAERVPLLRRWALRPDPRVLSLASAARS